MNSVNLFPHFTILVMNIHILLTCRSTSSIFRLPLLNLQDNFTLLDPTKSVYFVETPSKCLVNLQATNLILHATALWFLAITCWKAFTTRKALSFQLVITIFTIIWTAYIIKNCAVFEHFVVWQTSITYPTSHGRTIKLLKHAMTTSFASFFQFSCIPCFVFMAWWVWCMPSGTSFTINTFYFSISIPDP